MPDPSNDFMPAINRLLKDIDDLERDLAEKKRMVNSLCGYAGQPPRFQDVVRSSAGANAVRRDQYYGRPLASVIREFLEVRGPSDRGGFGAATVNEIYDALVQGGYKFDAKDEANAKRGLRIGLTKNSTTFHRVGDAYGLVEWYPNARPPRSQTGRNGDEEVPPPPEPEPFDDVDDTPPPEPEAFEDS